MLRQVFIGLLWIDNALCALAQGSFEQRDRPGRISRQLVRKIFTVRYKMCNVDVTIVLPDESILSNLVPVDERAIDLEGKDEFSQFGLDFCSWFFCTIVQGCKHTE